MYNETNVSPTNSADQSSCTLKSGLGSLFPFDLHFSADGDKRVKTSFQSDSRLQGYDGIIHGGILSALLDTAMARCLLSMDIEAVTGALNVRFFEPVPCNALLTITAWIEESLPPLYHLRAEIRVGTRRACKAKAKFMQRRR